MNFGVNLPGPSFWYRAFLIGAVYELFLAAVLAYEDQGAEQWIFRGILAWFFGACVMRERQEMKDEQQD